VGLNSKAAQEYAPPKTRINAATSDGVAKGCQSIGADSRSREGFLMSANSRSLPLTRRLFVALSLALVARPSVAAEDIVQLLLLRDVAEPISCGKLRYMKGSLYGIPSGTKLKDVSSALGLKRIARVEELPFEQNVPNASSIPAGIYSATIRTDQTKAWMTNENRRWRLELQGTKPRSAIQFHYGKDFQWSAGCVILTGTDQLICKEGSDSPEEAVAALREYVTSGHNSNTKILVKIAFAG
jgi:hypothetical protein